MLVLVYFVGQIMVGSAVGSILGWEMGYARLRRKKQNEIVVVRRVGK